MNGSASLRRCNEQPCPYQVTSPKGLRKGRKEYLHFIYTARGSLSELDTQVEIADLLGYLKLDESSKLQAEMDEVSKLLNGVIAYLSSSSG